MNTSPRSQDKKKRGMNPPRMGPASAGTGMSSSGSGMEMPSSGAGTGMGAGGSRTGMGGTQRADLPTHRSCATMDVHARLMRTVPRYAVERAQIEQTTLEFLRADDDTLSSMARAGGCRIPVVVHVVWNQPDQNISDAQIHSQIDVLNRDFQILNPDISTVPGAFQGLIGNPNLEFFLATQAPDGSPTDGIVRTRTNQTSFVDDDKVKSSATGGSDAWPADRYLNIWVCQLSGGLLGYAQFPGGPAATDGVVITHTGFGTTGTASPPFHLGRTATHEIGHWLDLFHIWGDDGGACTGTDQVSDTPNQGDANVGVPTFPKISCNNGPNGDLFMNYMDYVDDPVMVMFTQGQVARMQACLAGPRASICSGQVGGAPSASGPIVAWGSDRLDVFVIGTDSALYHKWWDGSNWGPSVTDWEYMGGICMSQPEVVAWGPNRLDVFVLGTDSALWHKWWDGSNWGPSVTGWESLGGTCSSRPEVVAWGSNRLDVFVLGTDNALYHKWWDGSAWGPSVTGWEYMGGTCSSPPRVVAWGPNRLDVFVLGTDHALYHKWWDGAAWGPSVTDWEYMGGTCLGEPGVVSWGSDRLDVFVLGTDNAVWHKWWDGSAWGPSVVDYEYMGGICTSRPEAVAWSANRLDLFVTGTDHALWHKWWNGSAWGPSVTDWEYLGGTISDF
ncbi:MAG: M43 family zinc metalloprotease [Thermomicrobiales bacterium]